MAGRPRNKKKKYRKLEKEQIPLQESPLQEPQELENGGKKKKKRRSCKKVHLSPLPDRYDPLEEGAAGEAESKEDKKYKRKQKVKKYAKNVGKAVRIGCRLLLIGLQGLASAYASPLGVVVTPSSR